MSKTTLEQEYELAADNIIAYIYTNDSANYPEISRYVFSDMGNDVLIMALIKEMVKLGWLVETSGRYRLTDLGEERRIS